MKAWAVIGAGFGDEGKGHMVDYLAQTLQGTKVVGRFNGGAQAGHTVVAPSGKGHVFSHVGSGTFAGAETVLGRKFIVNPYILDAEVAQLESMGFSSSIKCMPSAQVTTIFDMALNAAVELERGRNRHGSCGLGINETVTRGEQFFKLTIGEVRSATRRQLREILQAIHREWVPMRLKQLDIKTLPTEFHVKTGEVLKNDNYNEHVIRMLMGALHIELTADAMSLMPDETLILEGAQGLALDEELGTFPHVTRSRTGLIDALELTADASDLINTVQPIYVTRAYATRHGAGPFFAENEAITDAKLVDTTNVDNEWQGSLRFAPLNLQLLKILIHEDLARARLASNHRKIDIAEPVVAVTCLDQLGSTVAVYDIHGQKKQMHPNLLPNFIEEQLGYEVRYTSYGPTFLDVSNLMKFGV